MALEKISIPMQTDHSENSDELLTMSRHNNPIIILTYKGEILYFNDSAKQFFSLPPNSLGKTFKSFFHLNKLQIKQLYNSAVDHFKMSTQGEPQQFDWIEKEGKRPIKAFQVSFNRSFFDSQKAIIVRIADILAQKTLEWVLWSLARLTHHAQIKKVVDDIAKLASTVFNAEFALVNLVDKKMAYSVSHFFEGKKKKNISYSLLHAPCENVTTEKAIKLFNGNVQEEFPKDFLLQELNIHSYLGGPLINSENEVIGLFIVMSAHNIDVTYLNKTLFKLFIDRLSLELERLLSHKKLQLLASLAEKSPNPIIRISLEEKKTEIIYTNNAGRDIVEYWSLSKEKIPQKLLSKPNLKTPQKKVVRNEITVKDKTYLFTSVWLNRFSELNLYAVDITELKYAQEKMRDLAHFDRVTNIANRQFFENTFNLWLSSAKKTHTELALLLIDLDNFKSVNDNLGHDIGDKLLKTLSKRIAGCLRESDFIARLGGDEFVVLLKLSKLEDSIKIAEKINKALASPFELGEFHIETSCSIGISFYPKDGLTSTDLLKNADIAMYEAKKDGKNQFMLFADSQNNYQRKRLKAIKKDLKLAELSNQFHIDYQPQFNINLKKIVGFEAFIRWHHPKHGFISPNEFIPIAEQTGTLGLISSWVVKQALKDYDRTMKSLSNAKLSINIALSQLNDQNFVHEICEYIDASNIDNNLIVLDIAEQVSTVRYRNLDANLEFIRSCGIELSLDNYGSVHSSLTRLLEIPINMIKIDQNFLHTLEEQPKNQAFISGIIQFANHLNLQVIQKGVENSAQNTLIKSLGCHFAQGFYYCPPLPLRDLGAFIKTETKN